MHVNRFVIRKEVLKEVKFKTTNGVIMFVFVLMIMMLMRVSMFMLMRMMLIHHLYTGDRSRRMLINTRHIDLPSRDPS